MGNLKIEQAVGQMLSQPPTSSLSSISPINSLASRYGNEKLFLSLFTPDRQEKYCQNTDRCYAGTAPSLVAVHRNYGLSVAQTWLEIQIYDLIKFCKLESDESVDNVKSTANAVLTSDKYRVLKITELMCFFQEFKSGEYGQFYGKFDPLVLTRTLREFYGKVHQRRIYAQRKLEQAERESKYAESSQNAVNMQEWIAENPNGNLAKLLK